MGVSSDDFKRPDSSSSTSGVAVEADATRSTFVVLGVALRALLPADALRCSVRGGQNVRKSPRAKSELPESHHRLERAVSSPPGVTVAPARWRDATSSR
jgi:hypothetical protein